MRGAGFRKLVERARIQRARVRGGVHSVLEYQPGLEGAGRAREWPGAFGDASEVESEESCFHLGVSETADARFFLGFSPSLSRYPQREQHGRKKGYKHGNENR